MTKGSLFVLLLALSLPCRSVGFAPPQQHVTVSDKSGSGRWRSRGSEGGGAMTGSCSPPCMQMGTSTDTSSSSSSSSSSSPSSEASKQNAFGVVSDAVTGAAFSLLHAFDDCGIEDSSKNLRVLWVRALLNQRGMISDDVARMLLPKTTRGLVTTDRGANLFDPIIQFTEWIQARTEFIDQGLEHFLASPVCTDPDTGESMGCNVVLFGAGYDTRALRYRHRHDHRINFIEVDLPSVVEGKAKLYRRFRQENDPDWDLEAHGSTLVPFDLNSCGGPTPASLVETLRTEGGLQRDVPTFFVWEAVLFYVNEDAVRNILRELFDFAQPGRNGDSDRAETMLCFTDSLKPFVDVPFTNEATQFFSSNGLDLLEHRSRWGGAVHFALAATRGIQTDEPSKKEEQEETDQPMKTANNEGATATATSDSPTPPPPVEPVAMSTTPETTTTTSTTSKMPHEATTTTATGRIGRFVSQQVDGLVNSYTPTQSNNPSLLRNPSFDNAWYAVGYTWQIDGYENAVEAALKKNHRASSSSSSSSTSIRKPYATRLWGEPLVIYRDGEGELVAMADVCPHRSAALSMGTVENGRLTCFYHGWQFGSKGDCTNVPTMTAIESEAEEEAAAASASSVRRSDQKRRREQSRRRYMDRITQSNCDNLRGVAERDGVVYVWRGNVLEANPALLPSKRKGDMDSVPIDTVLDYSVDYSYIVENNLDSPHLFYLHDGSVPPIEEIGLKNENLPMLRLRAFTDDCGYGHLGRLGSNGRPKKLIRFDPPNVVRHGGVSGFEEEFHCVPVAPHRTRVLIRQHLPKGPILSTITSIPFMLPFLTALVNSWNYHIGLEDAAVMQGQAHRIEDLGAPRMAVGGLGDDLIRRYWQWRDHAHAALPVDATTGLQSPYYNSLTAHLQQQEQQEGQQQRRRRQQPSNGIIRTGTAFGDSVDTVSRVRMESAMRATSLVKDDGRIDSSTGNAIGTWGIKQNYLQNTPAANFPPMNYQPYANLLIWDDLVKSLLAGKEASSTMIKSQLNDFNTRQQQQQQQQQQQRQQQQSRKEESDNEKRGVRRRSSSGIGIAVRVVAGCALLVFSDTALFAGNFGRSLTSAVAEIIPPGASGIDTVVANAATTTNDMIDDPTNADAMMISLLATYHQMIQSLFHDV